MKDNPYEKLNPNIVLRPRKLARSVAKANMKKAGVKRINKNPGYGTGKKSYSVFARTWKNFVGV